MKAHLNAPIRTPNGVHDVCSFSGREFVRHDLFLFLTFHVFKYFWLSLPGRRAEGKKRKLLQAQHEGGHVSHAFKAVVVKKNSAFARGSFDVDENEGVIPASSMHGRHTIIDVHEQKQRRCCGLQEQQQRRCCGLHEQK